MFMIRITCLCLALALMWGCGNGGNEELAVFPLEDAKGTLATDVAVTDTVEKAEGEASLRIDADKAMTVTLMEIDSIDLENATLLYEATLKSKGMDSGAYLEMWCVFSGLGEYFSRGLQDPVTGDTDWTTVATPFFLKQGQNPDLVRLNLVLNGPGTVWIDHIRLLNAPLK